MLSENPILNLLSYQFTYLEPGIVVGFCPEFPNLSIRIEDTHPNGLVELLRNDAKKRLENGEMPQFGGKGRSILALTRDQKNGGTRILLIRDFWCSLSNEQLVEHVARKATDWIEKVGPKFYADRKEESHTVTTLSQLICRCVKRARKRFAQDKADWETQLAGAQQENEKRMASEASMKAMVDRLVAEAQRYIVSGGHLKELGNTKPPGATVADKWHRFTFDQFNKRSQPQQIHKEESKDDKGNVLKTRTWVENAGGGEIAAAFEQVHFILQSIARDAETGSEEAMYWLYHLAMFATQRFWWAVEAQPDLASRLSGTWVQIPIHWREDAQLHKTIKAKTKHLQMPKPRPTSAKVKAESPYQIAVSRTVEALNYLLRSPPIFMPPMPDGSRCDMLDYYLPAWLKNAVALSTNNPSDTNVTANALWDAYVAAMTVRPDSPWREQSRPRKSKEKFVQALKARKPKTP